ncbi:MAG: bestrophin family ion channel [Planctomycetota bacterium]
MFIKKKYSVVDMFLWTRWELLVFLTVTLAVTILYEVLGLRWLRLPWTPVALVGTAVAFLIGFQNNAAYGRAWEARKIWGGIINASRSWGVMVEAMINDDYAATKVSEEQLIATRKVLVYRHLAWLTALRHAMRESRPWEVFLDNQTNREWYEKVEIPERDNTLPDDLRPLLSDDEMRLALESSNAAYRILSLQSAHLAELKQQNLVWEFSFLELGNLVKELLTLQGQSERIKNFPYPRQYATLGYDFVRVFTLLLPLGIVPEFSEMGESLAGSFPSISQYFVWAAIPFTAVVSWVFHTMQRIGTVGENPFEGSANDVPISTMARTIEIDLRQNLGEPPHQIPPPLKPVHGVAM